MTGPVIEPSGDEGNIGSLRIDPAAEPAQVKASSAFAQGEENFFKNSGAQFHLVHNQQNLGVLGKLFGSNSSAPTNIAGFVIICSFLVISISQFFPGNADLVEARKWFFGLISSAVSFIFGAASKK